MAPGYVRAKRLGPSDYFLLMAWFQEQYSTLKAKQCEMLFLSLLSE